MSKVLVISRFFPPLGSAGASIRLTKLIKFSQSEGWSFIVITQDPEKPVIEEKEQSSFLLDELTDDLVIKRVSNPIFGDSFIRLIAKKIIGNSSIPWGIQVFKTGSKLIRNNRINLIFVNSPPFTNVAAGWLLSKLNKIPLHIDFKDDWVGSTRFYDKKKLAQKIDVWLEKKIVRDARVVSLATEESFNSYTKRYQSLKNGEKFIFCPNGIDLEEYKILENRNRQIDTQRFTILTAASGYRKDYRDLTPFFNGLNSLLTRVPGAVNNLDIIFLGDQPGNEYLDDLDKLKSKVFFHYFQSVGRKEFIEYLWHADLFLLIQPTHNYTSISGTLYEYWATGKAPILLISENGASSSLVLHNKIGEHYYFNQIDEISIYLEKIYQAYMEKKPVWIDRNGVEIYDRKSQAKKIMNQWEKVAPGDY